MASRTLVILMQCSLAAVAIRLSTPVPDQAGSPAQTQKSTSAESLRDAEEKAVQGVMEAAAAARKRAHGDGSDRFASGLEESVLDLEEMKHEMEEKQKQRHAKHETEKQALHAHFLQMEKERKLDHEEREREWKEEQKEIQARLLADEKEMKALEQEEKEMKARHKKEREARLVHLTPATSQTLAVKEPLEENKVKQEAHDQASEMPPEHYALRVVIFLAVMVCLHIVSRREPLSGGNTQVVKPGCWMNGLCSGMKNLPSSKYAMRLRGEERSTLAPLQPLNGAGYGGLTV